MTTRPILLIEDNADDQELTMLAFRRNSVSRELVIVRDGVEALDYLFRTGPFAGVPAVQPALVLLDLKLPRVDGIEVLQRLRSDERTRRLPVVVLTTSREQNDISRAYDAGASSYLVKPVDYQRFSETIAILTSYWLSFNVEP
jgi:two-component system, response regulator